MDTATIATEQLGDGVTLVAPAGEHDLHSSPQLARVLADGLDRGAVVLDLSAATFIDSSVLGEIVAAHDRAREEGRGFEVVLEGAGAPGVRRVLEVTGIDRVLAVRADRADAVAAAGGQQVPEAG